MLMKIEDMKPGTLFRYNGSIIMKTRNMYTSYDSGKITHYLCAYVFPKERFNNGELWLLGGEYEADVIDMREFSDIKPLFEKIEDFFTELIDMAGEAKHIIEKAKEKNQ